MRITSKGQVTIPQEVREKFGLLPQTEIEFQVKNNTVYIRKSTTPSRPGRGRSVIERMRGRATVTMSTDEIMALTRGE